MTETTTMRRPDRPEAAAELGELVRTADDARVLLVATIQAAEDIGCGRAACPGLWEARDEVADALAAGRWADPAERHEMLGAVGDLRREAEDVIRVRGGGDVTLRVLSAALYWAADRLTRPGGRAADAPAWEPQPWPVGG